MATPGVGAAGDLIGQVCDYLLGNPWGLVGGGLASSIVPEIWKRFKWPTKTKYGITNEEKKYGKSYSSLLRRKRKFKMYKWINNGYRYKRDFLIQVYVKDQSTKMSFNMVGVNTESEIKINILNVANTQVAKFRELFDQYHLSGVIVQFKPYQIVKTDSNADTNQIPNLLFTIMTNVESEQFGTISQDSDTIQKLTDRPFTKIIAADDDMRIYRPFKVKAKYDADDELLFSWVPTMEQPRNLFLVGLLVPGYTSARANTWNIGTIKLTLYYKFRSSKL